MELDPYLLGAGTIALFVVIVLSFRWPLLLLAVHLLSRFILDSMSAFTYLDTLPGLSFAKMYSIGTIALLISFLLLRREHIFKDGFFPVALLVLAHLVSATINYYWSGIMIEVAKWVYLFALMALTKHCIKISGLKNTALVYWLCLFYVLGNQLLVGITQGATFLAGQYSYYGTYGHESDVSFLLLLFICCSLVLFVLTTSVSAKAVYALAVAYGHLALILCNYRTSLIALGFVWIFLFIGWLRRSSVLATAILLPVVIASASVFLWFGAESLTEKMQDIAVVANDPGRYFDFSGNARPNGLLSGRIDLWNGYFHKYTTGGLETYVVGFGPTRGSDIVGAYAHNEYISALCETGLLGFAAFSAVIGYFGKLAFRAINAKHSTELAVAPLILGVLVMALGTMPFRNVRAMMLLAFCCAVLQSSQRMANKEI